MTFQALHTSFRMFLVCALGASLLQPLPARADVDYTDIWWAGPAEDGWGVNMIQSQDFIFATFFVYGPAPSKVPTWYAGNLTRLANGSFNGGLYQTTGTGIGVPWNPADHSVTQVGTATFTPTDATSGVLAYTVNGTLVRKDIVRQTLTPIAIGGSYVGTANVVHAGCADSSQNGTVLTDFDPVVTQSGTGQLQLDFLYAGTESCTFAGNYAQQGVLFRVPLASYVCKSGTTTTVNTTATIDQMKSTAIGLEGHWFVSNVGGGCSEDGKFATVFP
jgi:hypothetical protein